MSQSSAKIPHIFKAMFTSAGKLTVFIVISIVLLLEVKQLTADNIAQAERQTLLATFNQVLPPEHYTNNPLEDTRTLTNPLYLDWLGQEEPVTVYRAFQNEQPAGAIFKVIALNGYSGNIDLLVGIFADNRIAGVRILKHKETPGLGDKIEIEKSNWVLEFNGWALRDNNEARWAVEKDGGAFDQFTGATITPRAVVEGVRNALRVANDLGDKLYE